MRQPVEGEGVGSGGALGHALTLRVGAAGHLDPQAVGVLARIRQPHRRRRAKA